MAMLKVVSGPEEACRGIQSGMTLMLGGFGLCGIPENSIAELVKMGVNNLTCISNNAGVDDFGLGLLQQRQIKKMISSVGENDEFERQMLGRVGSGPDSPRLGRALPCRRCGYSRVLYPSRMAPKWAKARRSGSSTASRISLKALTADYAIVKAWKGDEAGNLIFKGTARNFNPMMAMAGTITIAEVKNWCPRRARP